MICCDSARLGESKAGLGAFMWGDDISPVDCDMVRCKESQQNCATAPVCLCVVAGNGGH